MAFSFGFSGEDIDIDNDIDEGSDQPQGISENPTIEDKPSNNDNKLFPAQKHLLGDWTTTLPSQISYNTLNLDSREEKRITLARRELFDVRAQLMAEDDDDDSELIAGLEEGDLKPNFYEGGFKTWECSLDLADLLLSSEGNAYDDGLHVVELGCGTAVPSLALFARLFSLPADQKERRFRFTLADYNSTVLRLVTLSNFLLTWWVNSPASPRQQNPISEEITTTDEVEEGELDIEPTLLDAFQADLSSRGITLNFISGGWSAEFVQLVLDSSITSTSTLILASETIYAPSSLNVFSETLVELLRCSGNNESHTTALIAAKKVYFGVGGGVDEFLHVLYKQPLQEGEGVDVQERKEIHSGGVKRVVLEVRIR